MSLFGFQGQEHVIMRYWRHSANRFRQQHFETQSQIDVHDLTLYLSPSLALGR